MRKAVAAFLVVSFAALESALFYAGHLGLNLADMTAPMRSEVMAKASLFQASAARDAIEAVPTHVANSVERAWKQIAAPSGTSGTPDATHTRRESAQDRGQATSSPTASSTSLADALSSTPTDDPRIDISRISPDGSSVFAGTARPNETLTLFADGTAIAEVTADDTGSWSLLTNYRFANVDPKLTLERGQHLASADGAKPEAEQAIRAETGDDHKQLAAREAEDALKNFEAIVDEARRENRAKTSAGNADRSAAPDGQQTAAAASPGNTKGDAKAETPGQPGRDSAGSGVATAETHSSGVANPAAREVVKIPVPITFVYKSAELTEDGAYAARLLLDYVKLKSLSAVSLTGHADERGSNAYNYELSRERLDTIAKLLRDGGYDGQLKLIPKGKSEPYQGVDRRSLSREALFQADRRVELKYVR